ncbi:hypothetical protein DCS_01831 [Drechmeria coniospora]|uniref:Uncharacterized protein n=1 Tax=Drechmeria coniospora TaxID=98403 RepID=A0A151GUF9_DRECN|nr:hypothetical protein DCS_01831 [Drechmeria coniospora]KYK60693.1 hypothetical protein DCS_01831 [Drechmeria coniospora]
MLAATTRFVPRSANVSLARRWVTTLPNNPHIKVFDNPASPASHVLTYLERNPPSASLAIGTCTQMPPTPASFRENARFMDILRQVVEEYGHEDEDVIAQAKGYAGSGGSHLGSAGWASSPPQRPSRGSARNQAGGGGRGGWVHLSDRRNPPDFGRIAWPEDILGSVEVDQNGRVIGRVQPSGTYRVVTNEGILGLSPFLREKLVERLKLEEARACAGGEQPST